MRKRNNEGLSLQTPIVKTLFKALQLLAEMHCAQVEQNETKDCCVGSAVSNQSVSPPPSLLSARAGCMVFVPKRPKRYGPEGSSQIPKILRRDGMVTLRSSSSHSYHTSGHTCYLCFHSLSLSLYLFPMFNSLAIMGRLLLWRGM